MDETTARPGDSTIEVPQNGRVARLLLLMRTFNLSIGEIARASGRAISKTQLHRILAGRKHPSPTERQAIATGVLACLRSRCDSAYLFGDEA